MASPGNSIVRRKLKQLPEDVGAETELLGGPEDDYHPSMDVPRWRGAIPETGLAPEMPQYGTPEIGLAPEMPNQLVARMDASTGEGALPVSVARRGEDSAHYMGRRSWNGRHDPFWTLVDRAGGWDGLDDGISNHGPISSPMDEHLTNYRESRQHLIAKQALIARGDPLTGVGAEYSGRAMQRPTERSLGQQESWDAYAARRASDPNDELWKVMNRRASGVMPKAKETFISPAGRELPYDTVGDKVRKYMEDRRASIMGQEHNEMWRDRIYEKEKNRPPLSENPTQKELTDRFIKGYSLTAEEKTRLRKKGWLFDEEADAVINKSKRR